MLRDNGAFSLYSDLALKFKQDGENLSPGATIVYGDSEITLSASLESSAIRNMNMNHRYSCTLRGLSMAGHIPRTRSLACNTGFDEGKAIEQGSRWRSSDRGRWMTYTLNPSLTESLSGVLTFHSIRLERFSWETEHYLVHSIEFEQNLYLRRQNEPSPFPTNAVDIDVDYTHRVGDFDVPLSLHTPQLTVSAIGNPKPSLTLRRTCAALGRPEVSVVESARSSFETVLHFRFENAADAVQGSYLLEARSGNMTAREVMSVGIV
nr:hypothetical protein BaRGS_011419 [Batillaria attramentaria]